MSCRHLAEKFTIKIFALADCLALEAEPLAAPCVGIRRCERMAASAICQRRVVDADSQATQEIDFRSEGLDVFKIHARVNSAQMVNLKTFRDGTDAELIHNFMRHALAQTIPINTPVSVMIKRCLPNPTWADQPRDRASLKANPNLQLFW